MKQIEKRMSDDAGYVILAEGEQATMRPPLLERIREAIARAGGAREDFEFQKYTKPKLRERIKNRIMRGTKGGRAGMVCKKSTATCAGIRKSWWWLQGR